MTRHPTARALSFAVATVLLALPAASQAQAVSDEWQQAELVPVINDKVAGDGCPIESPNGHYIYIASLRVGGLGARDIWRAFRGGKHHSWGPPERLPTPVNSMDQDFCPTPLHGRRLLFVSTRPHPDNCGTGLTGMANGDIYLTRERAPGHWDEPLHLGCAGDADNPGPGFAGPEFSPSLVKTREGTFLYYSSSGDPAGAGDQNLYVSKLGADGFETPQLVQTVPGHEVNTADDDRMPNVRRDGLEMVFSSNRPGGAGSWDVYVVSRQRTSEPWGNLRRLDSEVNTPAGETRATLSGDGKRLHFGRAGQVYRSLRR